MRRAAGFVALMLMSCGTGAALAQSAPPPIASARDFGSDHVLGVGMTRDSDRHSFAGLRGTSAFNVTEGLAIIVEAEWLWAIAERTASGRIIRDHEALALGGIRLRKFVESTAVPYLQVSAGYAGREDNALQIRRSLFAFRSEAGLDVAVSRHFGVRAGAGWTYLFVDAPYRHGFGGTIGVTFSLGKR